MAKNESFRKIWQNERIDCGMRIADNAHVGTIAVVAHEVPGVKVLQEIWRVGIVNIKIVVNQNEKRRIGYFLALN